MRLGVWPLSVLLCLDCSVCIIRGCCRLGNGDMSACGLGCWCCVGVGLIHGCCCCCCTGPGLARVHCCCVIEDCPGYEGADVDGDAGGESSHSAKVSRRTGASPDGCNTAHGMLRQLCIHMALLDLTCWTYAARERLHCQPQLGSPIMQVSQIGKQVCSMGNLKTTTLLLASCLTSKRGAWSLFLRGAGGQVGAGEKAANVPLGVAIPPKRSKEY
jgi:hypothetical protein